MFQHVIIKKALDLVLDKLIDFTQNEYVSNGNNTTPLMNFFSQFSLYLYTNFNKEKYDGDLNWKIKFNTLIGICRDKGI